MNRENQFLYQMKQVLKLVAADVETQVNSLPDFVHVPDEVVLTFDEAFILFDQVIEAGLVDERQSLAVFAVNHHFEDMNNKKDENLWTLQSMKKGADWQKLRDLARVALSAFGETNFIPDLGWITYVKGKKGDGGDI